MVRIVLRRRFQRSSYYDTKTRGKIRPDMEIRSADQISQHDREINSVWFEPSWDGDSNAVDIMKFEVLELLTQ